MRMIDADRLLDALNSVILDYTSEGKYPDRFGIDDAINLVEDAPTFTPPEIVCCQDCVNHEDGYAHWCNKWEHTCPDDSEFFCKYGRKKDGKDRSI